MSLGQLAGRPGWRMEEQRALTAAKDGDLDTLEQLLEAGTLGQHVTDALGAGLVHHAARAGHLACVRFLVQRAKLPGNQRAHNGASPAHDAAATGSLAELCWLVRHGGCGLQVSGARVHREARAESQVWSPGFPRALGCCSGVAAGEGGWPHDSHSTHSGLSPPHALPSPKQSPRKPRTPPEPPGTPQGPAQSSPSRPFTQYPHPRAAGLAGGGGGLLGLLLIKPDPWGLLSKGLEKGPGKQNPSRHRGSGGAGPPRVLGDPGGGSGAQ